MVAIYWRTSWARRDGWNRRRCLRHGAGRGVAGLGGEEPI